MRINRRNSWTRARRKLTFDDQLDFTHWHSLLSQFLDRIIREVRSKYFSAEHPSASTLVGVTALVRDGSMIEIEAVRQ